MKKHDLTPIYNKFVTLYAKTSDPEVEKKAWNSICDIVLKAMNITYYNFVVSNNIHRSDNIDMVMTCYTRLLERIHKWKYKRHKAYTVDYLYTVCRLEVVFALQNERQQMIDATESLDQYNDKQREVEDQYDNETYFD